MCLWSAWRELFAGSVRALGSQNLYSKHVMLLLLLLPFPQGEEALISVLPSAKGLKKPPRDTLNGLKSTREEKC